MSSSSVAAPVKRRKTSHNTAAPIDKHERTPKTDRKKKKSASKEPETASESENEKSDKEEEAAAPAASGAPAMEKEVKKSFADLVRVYIKIFKFSSL